MHELLVRNWCGVSLGWCDYCIPCVQRVLFVLRQCPPFVFTLNCQSQVDAHTKVIPLSTVCKCMCYIAVNLAPE
jgi:hypothetical protein